MNANKLSLELAECGRFVGSAFKIHRVYAEQTQSELARKLSAELGENINQSYICRFEKGDYTPNVERFRLLCKLVSAKPQAILDMAKSLYDRSEMTDGARTASFIEALLSNLSGAEREALIARLFDKYGSAVQFRNGQPA